MPLDHRSGVSVVVPAYNEAESIGQTLSALSSITAPLDRPVEIIVVDDGSTDGTPAVAAKVPGVKVLQHPANSGYGRSLLTGIESANHEIIAIIDADGTYPAESLLALLDTFDKGFDMVVGARQGDHYYTSAAHRFLRFIFRLLAEYTSGQSIPDINSGFRVFRRSPVLAQRSSVSTGFSFTTTITLLFMLNSLLVTYRPISYSKRVGKSKVRLFPDGLRSLQIIFTAIAQFNPLKLFLLLLFGDVLGNLPIAGLTALRWLAPFPAIILCLTWNTLCLIMAIAILTVAVIKPVPAPKR